MVCFMISTVIFMDMYLPIFCRSLSQNNFVALIGDSNVNLSYKTEWFMYYMFCIWLLLTRNIYDQYLIFQVCTVTINMENQQQIHIIWGLYQHFLRNILVAPIDYLKLLKTIHRDINENDRRSLAVWWLIWSN